ncbi:hypothetical protein BCR39DRAFT_528444 [Naematelia encephala]|uniref:F-box domain-containing protein n=1 Tax=Naematelia encephala TaxID=71784 RepID=A0A1Y2B7J0_9TREE|nr:hypothetical protein BCR39DRAFT_528444 [Naematelia encephala]
MSHPDPQPLPHLPIEILRHIASHLDGHTAARLARTCRALRDAGEMKVWENVDVTSGFYELDTVRNAFLTETHDAREARVAGIISDRLEALKSHPLRIESVQNLVIEPSTSNASALISLLEILAPHLRSLNILPLPTESFGVTYTQHGDRSFYTGLETKQLTFPRLVTLHCSLSLHPCESLSGLLRAMPHLERLELKAVESPDTAEIREGTDQSAINWPSMSRLSVLNIGDMDLAWNNLLIGVLQHARNIESVNVGGPWEPYERNSAVMALRKMPKLRQLVWSCGTEPMERDWLQRFKALQELVEESEYPDEADECFLRDIPFPLHATLTKYGILDGPRLKPSEYASLGVTVPTTPLPTRGIGHRALFGLTTAPALTQVQLFSYGDDDSHSFRPNRPRPGLPTSDPVFFTPPSEWEVDGSRGYLIRTYTRRDEATRTLYHVRSLTRARQHSGGYTYVGARRTWQDHTEYRGRTVPIDVLNEAYSASNLDREWIVPGRRLEIFNQEGWKVLDQWRENLLARGPQYDWSDNDDEDDEFDDDDMDGFDEDQGMSDFDFHEAFGDVEDQLWGSDGLPEEDDGWTTEDSDDPLGLFANADQD